MPRSLEEHDRRDIQIDHPTRLMQPATVFRVQNNPAPRCQDNIVVDRELGNGLSFSAAKAILALDLENGGNGHPRSLDYLMVRVIKDPPESSRQLTPNSRLASPHQADQIDIRTIIHPPILSEAGSKPKKKPAMPAFLN